MVIGVKNVEDILLFLVENNKICLQNPAISEVPLVYIANVNWTVFEELKNSQPHMYAFELRQVFRSEYRPLEVYKNGEIVQAPISHSRIVDELNNCELYSNYRTRVIDKISCIPDATVFECKTSEELLSVLLRFEVI